MAGVRSVAFKLSLLSCLFVLAVIAAMAHRILRATEKGLLGEMRVRAEFFARSSREAIFPNMDVFSLHFHVEELLKEKAVVYAGVMDASGKYLSHSDPRLIGETPTDPVSKAGAATPATLLQRREAHGGEEAYDLAAPIFVGLRRVGTVRLGFNRSSIQEALSAPKRQILVISLSAVALAVLGTLLIVGWITRPLPLLAQAAQEVGRGNFRVQVRWKSADEIGALAQAFNDMAAANAQLFDAIQQEKQKLETLFKETREGIVWTQSDGKVLLINPAAESLLGKPDGVPALLQDMLRDFDVRPRLPDILGSWARTIPCEMRREAPKVLVLSGIAERLGADAQPAGFLFIFHDATIEKREEGLARNFLSLVSHKLRTPMAVALGYLEILGRDTTSLNSFQQNALAKIRGEDEKLRYLIEKLIAFTTVQSPETLILEKAPMRLEDALRGALAGLKEALAGVEVSYSEDALKALPPVSADKHLVQEAIKNLVENAVKFNPSSAKKVSFSAVLEGRRLRVTVADNGPGIPSEEHPKLFRKFYQVDEHFTGQIPGMGLGLAFVKNVAEAHGGEAGLKSKPGKGSEFFLVLPL